MSTSLTENPACANTCAMPLPIVPAPMTPTVVIIVAPGSSCWFLVRGAWFLVRGAWFLVRGAWFLVRGAWFFVPGFSEVPRAPE